MKPAVNLVSETKAAVTGGLILLLACASLLAGKKLDAVESKLPPPLVAELEFLLEHPEYDFPLQVIVKHERSQQLPRGERKLKRIHGYKTVKTAGQLYGLLHNPQVEYVTLDTALTPASLPLTDPPSNSYLEAIGADEAQALGYDGTGIGVAVFDSGITNQDFGGRVVQQVDFTSGVAVPLLTLSDAYGHGTHVAGLIGGDGTNSAGLYKGVAPGVDIVALQVVDALGNGRISDLIAAIDWVIDNQATYNIRVANLSLGSPPLDSYVNDPLCQAVEQMVAAGIATAVSAGNIGKNAQYPEIWRSITSPGNSPAVITVGAINNKATGDLDDDVATSFSSRGPTYPDEIFKPDVTAPGNGVPSVIVPGSWIALNYPQYQLVDYPDYLALSGSSMATAFASGTAALMLQANPDLTPRMVKALMILTAVKLDAPHVLEQGNGLVNAHAAVKLAEVVDVPGRSVASQLVSPKRVKNGKTIWAGGAMASGNSVVYSTVVGPGANLWGNGVSWKAQLSWTSGTAWTDGLFDPSSEIWGDGAFWSDAEFWLHYSTWTGQQVDAEGFYWSDSVFWSDNALWVDGVFWSDAVFWTDSADGGDQ